jgi:hypothetical protein
MNNFVKLGFLGSLALGGVAAHASITVPQSTGSPGDVLLYADIVSAGNVIEGYVGDTGVSVDNVVHGTQLGNYSASTDANLSAFLSLAASTSGSTVLWSVIGGGGTAAGAPEFATTLTKPYAQASGQSLTSWVTQLQGSVNNANGLIGGPGTSLETSAVGLTGIQYNPLALVTDVSNWGGGPQNFITGLGTSVELYGITAAGYGGAQFTSAANEGSVSLTSTGLVYTPATGTVPLPAAVWLLGSGLLGLAGVARRKISG